ncbi:MAG: DUF2779 domain-containing protein, partial [Planctomycetes bacterium]|nr:DUF2779 domain-containing protein [Planctomycetota bacterium]
YQPIFVINGYITAVDILKFSSDSQGYSVYEVKSSSKIDRNLHYHDLSFQVNLLKQCGLKIDGAYLIHINSEYVRSGELNLTELFKIVDVSSEIESVNESVEEEMAQALTYLSHDVEPDGYCCCIYKGRSRHCSTFQHSNPEVPDYSVHDIARIGSSKAKLKELIDSNIFNLDQIPVHIKLTAVQQKQVDAYVRNEVTIVKDKIREELHALTFPLYFLDYETCPSAIPLFNGFSPYTQIPFQYSVQVLQSVDSQPVNYQFLHVTSDDPSVKFADSLQSHIGDTGSVIVWHKSFECTRNNEITKRITSKKLFMDNVNNRIYDLEDIFKKQLYVHRDFMGSTSIKKILPVLAPQLKYEELEIRDGASAAVTWSKIRNNELGKAEKEKAINSLKTYCSLDTYAMYSIWCVLLKVL